MITSTTAAVHCEHSHDDHRATILVGYAGTFDNSFGHFIAQQPINAEIISGLSGRRCRWTGEYTMKNGHRAAILQVLDRPELGNITIHTCGGNVWYATGHFIDSDGNRGQRDFDTWPESLGEQRIREARENVAALREARKRADREPSQCVYCYTERAHDYAHPHVVRAVNEDIIANYVRPAYLG
jgi:hypothetical protein